MKVTPCPKGQLCDAILAHCQPDVCLPCARLFVGVGKDRYEHCQEFRRLEGEFKDAICTCLISRPAAVS